MYRGFNVTGLTEYSDIFYDQIYDIDDLIDEYKKEKKVYSSSIKKYFTSEKVINGTMMQSDWFPNVSANVFISHSHNDLETALLFKKWLKDSFGIKAFIDSTIWGDSEKLQKIIDEKIAWQPSSGTYNYDKRNFTTSHVHMMLNMALMKMIEICDAFFFLNSNESIPLTINGIENNTFSPWIYSEICMSKLIKKRARFSSRMQENFAILSAEDKKMNIAYKLDLGHLEELTCDDLNNWVAFSKTEKAFDNFDILYDVIKPI